MTNKRPKRFAMGFRPPYEVLIVVERPTGTIQERRTAAGRQGLAHRSQELGERLVGCACFTRVGQYLRSRSTERSRCSPGVPRQAYVSHAGVTTRYESHPQCKLHTVFREINIKASRYAMKHNVAGNRYLEPYRECSTRHPRQRRGGAHQPSPGALGPPMPRGSPPAKLHGATPAC